MVTYKYASFYIHCKNYKNKIKHFATLNLLEEY